MTSGAIETHLPRLGRKYAVRVSVRVQSGRDDQIGEHLGLLGELVEEFMILYVGENS